MSSVWAPVINGLQEGSLVEIFGVDHDLGAGVKPSLNGQRGQLVECDEKSFSVALLNGHVTGTYVEIDPKYVRACTDLQKPGQGGDEDSFDIVTGPRTKRDVLGEEIASCLVEKGFCVVKMIQDADAVQSAFDELKKLEEWGSFCRLTQEVEEGYLGQGTRAKVMWMNPYGDAHVPELLLRSDDNMTTIAEIVQPFCEDACGTQVADRTPAMACLTMTDRDEEHYERPESDDQSLLDYYNIWSRSVLRVVQFVGPQAGTAILEPKTSSPIKDLSSEVKVTAAAGTMIIVREDVLHYMYDEPDDGDSGWIQCFLLSPEPSWTLDDMDGSDLMEIFGRVIDGPPPPTQAPVAIRSLGIQTAANMVSPPKEWSAYMAGVDGQLLMPTARFYWQDYYTDDSEYCPAWKTYVKHFSVQEGIELFDNKVFEISNSESQSMDPMCRQVLEVGYILLLGIGMTKKVSNQKATHASVSVGNDKQEWHFMEETRQFTATNNQLAIAANRFNYVFNLKGGSYVCDTACSSSLVAAHLGRMNILERRYDPIEFHIGMGTGLTLMVTSFIGSCASHMLSPGGRCFTFNATANGYNRGDGTGGILFECGEHKDDRFALFRGSEMGNDGRSASMAAPNGPAQEKCVWGAVRAAQMTPPESTVWECHGTGTALGDPIEVGAVRKVQIKFERSEPLMIASCKSNLGHLEGSAAAIAMVKCVMTVHMNKCPSTIHFNVMNPHLDHHKFHAFFVSEFLPYKYSQGHAQVSSFGVGGTNGHAIFWGEADDVAHSAIDPQKLFLKKLSMQKPTIIADGPNPEDWDYSGPDLKAKPGTKYIINIEKDPITGETPIRWVKTDESEDSRGDSYAISGNFNDWSDGEMDEGDVPNVFYADVEVPAGGSLQFQFLVDGDSAKKLGPSEPECSRRTAPLASVCKDDSNFWVIRGQAGDQYRIDLLAPPRGPPTVNWFKI